MALEEERGDRRAGGVLTGEGRRQADVTLAAAVAEAADGRVAVLGRQCLDDAVGGTGDAEEVGIGDGGGVGLVRLVGMLERKLDLIGGGEGDAADTDVEEASAAP